MSSSLSRLGLATIAESSDRGVLWLLLRGTGSVPWLDTGLEADKGDDSPSLAGRISLEEPLLCPGLKPVILDRCAGLDVATESPRFRPVPACTLHLLLTLSERFIIALCTKPPSPLVGEGGRPAEERILDVLARPYPSTSECPMLSGDFKDGGSRAGDFEGETENMETGRVWAALSGKEACLDCGEGS